MIGIAEELTRKPPRPTIRGRHVENLKIVPLPSLNNRAHPQREQGMRLLSSGALMSDVAQTFGVSMSVVKRWKRLLRGLK